MQVRGLWPRSQPIHSAGGADNEWVAYAQCTRCSGRSPFIGMSRHATVGIAFALVSGLWGRHKSAQGTGDCTDNCTAWTRTATTTAPDVRGAGAGSGGCEAPGRPGASPLTTQWSTARGRSRAQLLRTVGPSASDPTQLARDPDVSLPAERLGRNLPAHYWSLVCRGGPAASCRCGWR